MDNSIAEHDVLTVVSELTRNSLPTTISTVKAVLFFAYVLSVHYYRAEWGYRFTATPHSTPTSSVVDSAVNDLVISGLLLRLPDGRHLVSDRGRSLMSTMRPLLNRDEQSRSIATVCDLLMLVPGGLFREALSADPGIRSGLIAGKSQRLDHEPLARKSTDLTAAIQEDSSDAEVALAVLEHLSSQAVQGGQALES